MSPGNPNLPSEIPSPLAGQNKVGSLPLRWFLTVLLLAAVSLLFFSKAFGHRPTLTLLRQDAGGIDFQPETERELADCVIGVNPDQPKLFMLPALDHPEKLPPAQYLKIRQQLYWLDFEFSHGTLLKALPAYTRIYVALPEAAGPAEGDEKPLFLEYLKGRCGWTDEELRWRVYFFKTPQPMLWSQDIGKIVGRDAGGRWVILRGPNDQEAYRSTVEALCRDYPGRYTFRDLPRGVSAEGGDEDLVRTPDGRLAFLAGRHRAESYLRWMNGTPLPGSGLVEGELNQVQNIFSDAFGQMPVFFLPAGVLRNPSLGNNELFHLDMLAAVLANPASAHAFVPTYLPFPQDRLTRQPLKEDFVRSLQGEYDMAAQELNSLGYDVVRLPFDDHPVRSPVNVVRFYDSSERRFKLLVAKYPLQGPGIDGPGSQEALTRRLEELNRLCRQWQEQPGGGSYASLLKAIDLLWREMDASSASFSPTFNQVSGLYRKAGFDVIPVSDYAWGAGGLHCQLLH